MAAIWNLPVIFVCENNQYACNTPFVRASNTKDVANRARGYNIPSMIADGQDVWQVYEKAREAVAYARNGNGPVLMECKTYRWYEHCVGDPDLRPGEEKAAWIAQLSGVTVGSDAFFPRRRGKSRGNPGDVG